MPYISCSLSDEFLFAGRVETVLVIRNLIWENSLSVKIKNKINKQISHECNPLSIMKFCIYCLYTIIPTFYFLWDSSKTQQALLHNIQIWSKPSYLFTHVHDLFFTSVLSCRTLWRSLLRWSWIFQRPCPSITVEYIPCVMMGARILFVWHLHQKKYSKIYQVSVSDVKPAVSLIITKSR